MVTLKKEISRYRPAIALEKMFPRKLRFILIILLTPPCIISALIITYIVFTQYLAALTIDGVGFSLATSIIVDANLHLSILLILIGPLFVFFALTFFYNQLYFRGIENITLNKKIDGPHITYEVAELLHGVKGDITRDFLLSPIGIEILKRVQVDRDSILEFLSTKKNMVPIDSIELIQSGFLTMGHVAQHIYQFDQELQDYLFSKGVSKEAYMDTSSWLLCVEDKNKHDSRWWSRENLEKIRSIGKEWSYGGAYMLEDYNRDMNTTGIFSVLSRDTAYADEKVDQLETIMARATDANALLVGDPGVGKMDIVARLGQKIERGEALSAISDYRVTILDTNRFIAAHDSKERFEPAFIKMMGQAAEAGNIIIVLDNLPTFLESAHALGSDTGALMDTFLASPSLHIIATSDPIRYHNEIESRPQLASRFERVQIESPDLSSTARVVESLALEYENTNKVTFTYFSIKSIVEAAEQYITDGVMPDKAIDFMVEVASRAGAQGVELITKEFVYSCISEKTGIPAGPMTEPERDKLMNLEELLHERVIGQNNAIKAIASAMRRARAGVQSTKRPMGSLLFLGPTGVGKTEAAKALAALFFEDENRLMRFDMSEFSGPDALKRLIGEGTKSGLLPNTLKENPYGVLLLDEFEKARSEVHDLFLQIIDEGIFSDARGSKINARNTIIIATSNAGAQIIMDFIKAQEDPSEKRDAIIDGIIGEGTYRPELINRFDGVIIFKPLTVSELEEVAKLMLGGLKKRIKDRGYELVIDEVLINLLVTEGYDPKFGARPMRRVMQDRIEDKIAEKIIQHSLKPGEKIWFYEEDFQE